MKKMLSVILAFVLVMSMATTVFAADAEITTGGNQSAETVVTYDMTEGYTVIIPESVVIDATTKKGTAIVGAENIVIAYGKTLNVTISGDDYADAWELIDVADATNKVKYLIGTTEGGEDIVNESVVLTSAAGDNWNSKVEETIYFSLGEDVEKAGSYEDTLTFTVSID